MKVRRDNEQLLRWLRGALFFGLSSWALHALNFTPTGALPVLALVVGAAALFAPGVAVFLAIVLIALPILAADIVTGGLFLLIGFALIHHLTLGHGRAFLFLGYAFLLASLGPAWAIPVLAGLWLGASEGAVVALLTCMAMQVGGLVAGRSAVGPVVTGGGDASLAFGGNTANLFLFDWLAPATADASFTHLAQAFSSADHVTLLILQPFVWAAGAAIAGSVKVSGDRTRRVGLSLVAVFAGVAATGVASVIAAATLAETPASADIVSWGGGALVLAGAVVVARELLFPLVEEPPAGTQPAPSEIPLAASDNTPSQAEI